MVTSAAYDRLLDALRSHGRQVRDNSNGHAMAQCPAHDDRNPSLGIKALEGMAVMYCYAGCSTPDVLDALGLMLADLFDNQRDTTYDYPDKRRVHRTPDKRFKQSGNTKGSALFHADRIGEAPVVYVSEGEKDALAIEAVGGVAVCSAMGAGKAHKADWSPLNGKHVVIIRDKDDAGHKHADQVTELVTPIAQSVQIVEAVVGKDAADHIAAGYPLEALVLVRQASIEPKQLPDQPRVFRATELQPARQPEWLARQWLPRAAVSLLIGPEGIGKSLLWVWLVAFITTGKPSPEFGIPARDPARVLLILTEDDWSTEVLPRLLVAGADISMIDVICTQVDGSGSPVFPRDMQLIRETGPDAALIVVDAWLDTVPAQIRVRDTQQAREALHPWKEAATSTGAAVLLVTHTNRITSGDTRDTYGATVGLRQKARMALYGIQDDEGNLVIGPDKANGVATVNANVFRIDSTPHFPPTADHDGTVGQLHHVRESDRTIKAHVLGAYEAERGDDPQEQVNAEMWLRDYLLKEGPQAKSAETKREAGKVLISDKMLRRAREKLRVVCGYKGFPAESVWSLPEQLDDSLDDDSDSPEGDDSDSCAPDSISLAAQGTTAQNVHVSAGQGRYAQSCPMGTTGHDRAQVVPPAETGPNSPVVPFEAEKYGAGTTGDSEHTNGTDIAAKLAAGLDMHDEPLPWLAPIPNDNREGPM
jgi:AAA domain/Toprim domain